MKNGLILGMLLAVSVSASAEGFKIGQYAKKAGSCSVVCKPASGSCEDLMEGQLNISIRGAKTIITPGFVDRHEMEKFTFVAGGHTSAIKDSVGGGMRSYTLADGFLMVSEDRSLQSSVMTVEALGNGQLKVMLKIHDKVDRVTNSSVCTFEKI